MKAKKYLSVLIILSLCGCAHISQVQRSVTSMSAEGEIEEIDTKLEKPWKGDIATEHQTLRDLGQVIGGFVAKEAQQHQSWRKDLQQLQDRNADTLSKKEKRRKQALEIILNDLPRQEGLATRDVHRRPQACLNANLTVRSDLAPEYSKGVFQPGAKYEAIVRYSNGNPRNLPDFAPDARGMAVKLLPTGTFVQGYSASELNNRGVLDFLAINFPVFFVNDPQKYVKINQAFLGVSSDPESAIDANSLRFKLLHDFPSVFLKGMSPWEIELALDVNGSIISNPLHETYWSMMAYRLGNYQDSNRTAVKYIWAPCKQNLPSTGVPVWTKTHDYAKPYVLNAMNAIPKDIQKNLSTEENRYYLRKNLMTDLVSDENAPKKCYELQVQTYIDEENTPIEDTTQIWLENVQQQKMWAEKFASRGSLNPLGKGARREWVLSRKIAAPVSIARLEIDAISPDAYKNALNNVSTNTLTCEDLSFNPWNNVPSAHKPLGIVGRMRKSAYKASRQQRHDINQVPDSQNKQ